MNATPTFRAIDILKMSTDYLEKKHVANPRLNAELLLGHVLKMSRVQLYLNFEQPLTNKELDQTRALLKRRGNHEPIQYILGETEFYSLKLKVDRYTLIPRPETEILVDSVIEHCRKDFDKEQSIEILDIGTGSGNIAIALAKNIERSVITAIDVQDKTLQIAQQNAVYHQVDQNIKFIKQDIFTDNLELSCIYNVIVSNPPYISEAEFEQLPGEVRDFEPEVALKGGEEGLDFYYRVLQLAKDILLPKGFIGLEIDYNKAAMIKEIGLKYGFKDFKIIKDFNEIDRVLIAKKANM